MKISRIRIENYKAIKALDIDCRKQINCFVGMNGSGKTTLLNAINILMSWFVARLKSPTGRGLSIDDKDISYGAKYCLLEVELDNEIKWTLYKQRSSNREKLEYKTSLEQLNGYVANLLKTYSLENNQCELPTFSFYPVNRSIVNVPLRIVKKHAMSGLDAYNKPSETTTDFTSFFEWFREREDEENEQYRQLGYLKEDSQLKAVRDAIGKVLPEYSNFRVQRNPRAFVMDKNGQKCSFEQLSDGEKCYIALIADIARRLSMTHTSFENALEGCGVVLIDEVDLHLHPIWQIELIEKLRKTFPNCQFFITTHSPLVITDICKNENDAYLMVKDGVVDADPIDVFGGNVDEILTVAFNMGTTRSQRVSERMEVIIKKLNAGEIDSIEFTENMEWLKDNIDNNDPFFAKVGLMLMKNKKEHEKSK